MEEIFNITYNKKMDKPQTIKKIENNKTKKETNKNKIIPIIFLSFISLTGIDIYLILSFIKILENI